MTDEQICDWTQGLVSRLRLHWHEAALYGAPHTGNMMKDAANEIERLAIEVGKYRHALNWIARSTGSDDPCRPLVQCARDVLRETPAMGRFVLRWECAPVMTEWGEGMMGALLPLGRNSTLRLYAHISDIHLVLMAIAMAEQAPMGDSDG